MQVKEHKLFSQLIIPCYLYGETCEWLYSFEATVSIRFLLFSNTQIFHLHSDTPINNLAIEAPQLILILLDLHKFPYP